MSWLSWLLLVTTVLSLSIAIFLGKEMLRKFRFHSLFMTPPGDIQELRHTWPGGSKKMRNIILEADQPFNVLIGFELIVPLLNYEGTDWFGVVKARKKISGGYHAIISTFTGRRPVIFCLLINSEVKQPVKLLPLETKQFWKPHLVCPPHLYQRLGFFV